MNGSAARLFLQTKPFLTQYPAVHRPLKPAVPPGPFAEPFAEHTQVAWDPECPAPRLHPIIGLVSQV